MESLDDIRAELDAIDGELHALIMRRAEVARRVAAAKARENGGEVGFAVRPGREAQMLRALRGAHEGDLPFEVVARMWKELINAMTRLQAPLEVVVEDAHTALLDLARDQFGSATPFAFKPADQVIDAVKGVRAGVISAEEDGWWRSLAIARSTTPEAAPYIIVALPFVSEGGLPKAFALGPNAPEASGEDITFGIEGETFITLDGFFDPVSFAHEKPGAIYLGASAKPIKV